jgi:hypothetical protein
LPAEIERGDSRRMKSCDKREFLGTNFPQKELEYRFRVSTVCATWGTYAGRKGLYDFTKRAHRMQSISPAKRLFEPMGKYANDDSFFANPNKKNAARHLAPVDRQRWPPTFAASGNAQQNVNEE